MSRRISAGRPLIQWRQSSSFLEGGYNSPSEQLTAVSVACCDKWHCKLLYKIFCLMPNIIIESQGLDFI